MILDHPSKAEPRDALLCSFRHSPTIPGTPRQTQQGEMQRSNVTGRDDKPLCLIPNGEGMITDIRDD